MKKLIKITCPIGFILFALVAAPFAAHGQNPIPVPNISMLTNRAALAHYASRQVGAVSIKIAAHSAIGGVQRDVLEYSESVKSFDGISRLLEGRAYGFRVTGTNQYVSIELGCYSSVEDGSNDLEFKKGRALFRGYAGGNFVQGDGDYFYLPEYASQPEWYLGNLVRVKIPGVVFGRLLRRNGDGYYPNEDPIFINGNDDFIDFQPDWAGAGDLILTMRDERGGYYDIAFDLVDAGRVKPINELLVRLGQSRSSPDVIMSRNPETIKYVVWTFPYYTGKSGSDVYGTIPLVELVNDFNFNGLTPVSITANNPQANATAFRVIELSTGFEYTAPAVEGSALLRASRKGTYHIIPIMPIRDFPREGTSAVAVGGGGGGGGNAVGGNP